MKKSVTVKDVAALAAVSATTVSYVLTNNPGQTISEPTRARVLEAARQLNYVPNNAARILKNSRSKCVSVVIGKTLAQERFALTVQGIRSFLNESGYNILLCSPDRTSGVYADYLESYFSHYLDGMIYMGRDNVGPKPEEMEILKKKKVPLVLFDCKLDSDDFATVDFDYYTGAYQFTQSLIANGCQRSLYLRPEADNPQEREREAGFWDALRVYPKIEKTICRFPITSALLGKLDQGSEAVTESVNQKMKVFLRESVAPVIRNFSEHDLIISSWGVYINQIAQLLETLQLQPLLATLAELSLFGGERANIKYCRMNHYQAGLQCAQLLLGQITNRNNVSGERHVVIPVEVIK